MKHDITIDDLFSAIHRHCLECSGGSIKCVDGCNVRKCNLYPYRSKKAMGIEKKPTKLKGQIGVFDLMKGGIANEH